MIDSAVLKLFNKNTLIKYQANLMHAGQKK